MVTYTYRRGTARYHMGNLEAAKNDLLFAWSLQRTHKDVIARLLQVKQAIAAKERQPVVNLPPPPVLIDHSAFPHIIESIVANAGPELRVTLRNTCRGFRHFVSSLATHNELTSGTDEEGLYVQWLQPAPLGKAFRIHKSDMLPKLTVQEDRERNALISNTIAVDHHMIDICGVIPRLFLRGSVIELNTNVLRIRSDKDDQYEPDDLNLFFFKIGHKVVVFPPTVEPSHADIPLPPLSLALPKHIQRLVYPLLIREDAEGNQFQFFTRFMPKLISRSSAADVLRLPLDKVTVVEPEVVIICATAQMAKITPFVGPIVQKMEDQLRLLIVGALWWEAHCVTVVNYKSTAPLWRAGLLEESTGTHAEDDEVEQHELFGKPAVIKFMETMAETRLRNHVIGDLEDSWAMYNDTPSSQRGNIPPKPSVVETKLKFVTEDEYRATLKPGEWEEETVEVFPGFE